jgi:hypothetical protein
MNTGATTQASRPLSASGWNPTWRLLLDAVGGVLFIGIPLAVVLVLSCYT